MFSLVDENDGSRESLRVRLGQKLDLLRLRHARQVRPDPWFIHGRCGSEARLISPVCSQESSDERNVSNN